MSELGSISKTITESGLVQSGAGIVSGFIVGSHTNGTVKFRNGLTAAGTIITPQYTLPAGSGIYMFPDAIAYNTGLYASIGGTVDIAVIYKGL